MKKLFTLFILFVCTFKLFAQDSTAILIESGKYGQIPTPVGSEIRMNGTSWTLEAWVYIPSSPFPQQMFVVETYSTTNTGGFALRVNSNYKLQAYQISGPSSSVAVNGINNVNFGAWNHIAATFDKNASTLNLYLNGVLDATTTCSLQTTNTNDNLYIGARGDDQNIWQTIYIDEVRIWNVAKSESQLAGAMNSCLIGNESGLAAYYTFENQSDEIIQDKTLNGNNGNINNFVGTVLLDGVFDCTGTAVNLTENESSHLSVYPNPTNSNLTIQTDEIISAIHVYNTAGILIQTETKNTFSVENLPAGIYFMQLQTESGINTTRFIKE